MKKLLLLLLTLINEALWASQHHENPAFASVPDVPGLPRVLLLGDSISIGYTLPVRAALQGRANVHRPPTNCSSTGYALANLDTWLGAGTWDVIHFNFGLHDAKLPPEGTRHAPLDVYERNLREIVRRLRTTGARLIWATTTPVPLGGNLGPNRRFGDVAAYNAAALRVMRDEGVAVNDLHTAILPHVDDVGRARDVHFTSEGYNLLAGYVAAAVEHELHEIAPGRTVVGLSMYSLRELIRAQTLDPLDYPAFAKREFGITAIDLWEGGLPKDRLDDEGYLAELQARARESGSDLFLLMAGVVDATGATSELRAAEAKKHFPSVRRAAALGCRYLRVFVKAPDTDRDKALVCCVEALRPLVREAGMKNVTVVIEPGSSVLSAQGDFLAELAERLADPRCRLMPDFGKLKGDVYAGTAAMMPHAAVVSAKMHNFDAAGQQRDFDYFRLMGIVRDAGFSGIIAIEWEGKGLAPMEGVRISQRLIEQSLPHTK